MDRTDVVPDRTYYEPQSDLKSQCSDLLSLFVGRLEFLEFRLAGVTTLLVGSGSVGAVIGRSVEFVQTDSYLSIEVQ